MSIRFNDTVNKNGIIQLIERNTEIGDGGITGNASRLAQFTADVNIALAKVWALIFKANGRWQFDDSNHSDYPIIATDLLQGQRDYSFTTDEQGNLILDIYKVMVADEQGIYYELRPVDQQSDEDMASFYDGRNTQGKPTRYDKTANGIFLDAIPAYNYRNAEEGKPGVKLFINREGSYFSSSDTTKMAGFSGLFHEYLALRPSYQYAYRKGLKNAKALQNEMLLMESDIKQHYRDRGRDEQSQISGEEICAR